ncbi:LacI family DNA-binding transcriptional regulator [Streptomyces sp. TP-A0874]|uniref:LacI family DNA-binding transcriptional regulator n=1 Tax=Streptomyces sp. TP-A0874 TaxID=549819 RepID=UPI000853BB59|nr:LacI family DNA-binding transcriptional regulator [Streptomyces sp. TP-A0874]
MAVSIGDVAHRAGVSRTTVSHVISGKRRVSEAVTKRVRSAMEELGYVPSRTAQNLAHGTTRTIGLLVPDIGNSYFADIAKGVEGAAIRRGFNVVLCNTGWNLERELFYIETLRSRAVDGVVYAAGVPAPSSQLTEMLAGMPVVAVDEELGDVALATIVSDNEAGGRMVAEHLADLGHTRALIVGVNSGLESARRRVEGFSAVWEERTGSLPSMVEGSFEEKFGYHAVKDRAPSIGRDAVTAVFALNDMAALGVLRALAEEGLSVPDECSVVGFDDIFTARHTTPGITTVRQDAVAMGSIAADTLLNVLDGASDGGPVRDRVLPVSLIERQTTALARPSGS